MNSPTMHRVLNLKMFPRTPDLPMEQISVSLFQPNVNGMYGRVHGRRVAGQQTVSRRNPGVEEEEAPPRPDELPAEAEAAAC